MAIDAYGNNLTTSTVSSSSTAAVKDKTKLGKDDFMTLLLVELQNQDPTEPTDTDKILTQTSQLATLESSDKTNKSLEDLSTSLTSSQQFSTISAIGKTADLGSDAITHTKNSDSTFEVYFPDSISQGTVSITDTNGQIVKNLDVGTNPSGVYKFTWDGTDMSGNPADDGVYHVNSKYTNQNNEEKSTRLGAYPIESVKFNDGKSLVKVGSNYVPLESVVEIY